MSIQVFDKPMCCSTGICGPQVDQTLVRFATDLDWLSRQGVTVERFNLSQQPPNSLSTRMFAPLCKPRGWTPCQSSESMDTSFAKERIPVGNCWPRGTSRRSGSTADPHQPRLPAWQWLLLIWGYFVFATGW